MAQIRGDMSASMRKLFYQMQADTIRQPNIVVAVKGKSLKAG